MKHRFDRRQFIAGSAAVLSSVRWPQAWGGGTNIPKAPVARVQVVRDQYFGETLSDPYRWMENDKDPEWLPFLQGQNAHARAVLDALPQRAALLKRIQELSGDMVATSRVERAGGMTFVAQRPLGADNYQLFVRRGTQLRSLVDPTAAEGPGHMSLDWWHASPDGKHVAYGLSRNGSEDSTLHVVRVSDAQVLPERIADTQLGHPQWLDDGSGFFYNQLTQPNDTPERYLDSQARFHRLGTDPASDPILMKRGLVPGVDYERIQNPYIRTYRGRNPRDPLARRRAQRGASLDCTVGRGDCGPGALDAGRRLRRRSDRCRSRRGGLVPPRQQRLATRPRP